MHPLCRFIVHLQLLSKTIGHLNPTLSPPSIALSSAATGPQSATTGASQVQSQVHPLVHTHIRSLVHLYGDR